jgi:hypothetical protein
MFNPSRPAISSRSAGGGSRPLPLPVSRRFAQPGTGVCFAHPSLHSLRYDRSAPISDDNGPSEQAWVRFIRDWSGVKKRNTFPATFYPKRHEFHIGAPVHAVIGPHPQNDGLLERIDGPVLTKDK